MEAAAISPLLMVPSSRLRQLSPAVVLSLMVHAAMLVGLTAAQEAEREKNEAVEVQIVETVKPEPPPPPEPPKPPPTPEKKPVVVAKAPPAPVPEAAPPPPNQPEPREQAQKPVPVFVGISMSSTTTAGGFAAPVGNTLYGAAPEVAPNPGEVKPYTAKKYVPPHMVQELPAVVDCTVGKEHYPEEAKKQGVEGQVIVRLRIDETGKVVSAKLVQGVGYGLDEKALWAASSVCRFRPGKINGEPITTEIIYTFTFELE